MRKDVVIRVKLWKVAENMSKKWGSARALASHVAEPIQEYKASRNYPRSRLYNEIWPQISIPCVLLLSVGNGIRRKLLFNPHYICHSPKCTWESDANQSHYTITNADQATNYDFEMTCEGTVSDPYHHRWGKPHIIILVKPFLHLRF